MTTPEPLDEQGLTATVETRGGDHLADITVRPPVPAEDDDVTGDDDE